MRGDDGLWYAFGTSDPLREGEGRAHRVPIAHSADLVEWSYVGDAFTADQRPADAAPGSALRAPDVRRVAGRWGMYMTVTDCAATPTSSPAGSTRPDSGYARTRRPA
ncbi:family 43 glycosylhydrolase [Micromonospora chalcea]|uniref:family 43 glycosylhydrolase n=1 Tax=Micromonospora chalcea TaxID=1874 RepID=UPI00381E134B